MFFYYFFLYLGQYFSWKGFDLKINLTEIIIYADFSCLQSSTNRTNRTCENEKLRRLVILFRKTSCHLGILDSLFFMEADKGSLDFTIEVSEFHYWGAKVLALYCNSLCQEQNSTQVQKFNKHPGAYSRHYGIYLLFCLLYR